MNFHVLSLASQKNKKIWKLEMRVFAVFLLSNDSRSKSIARRLHKRSISFVYLRHGVVRFRRQCALQDHQTLALLFSEDDEDDLSCLELPEELDEIDEVLDRLVAEHPDFVRRCRRRCRCFVPLDDEENRVVKDDDLDKILANLAENTPFVYLADI